MLTRLPIQRALWRRNLVLGGERDPVILTAGMCLIVGGTSFNLVAICVSVASWFFMLGVLRWMAKVDPHLCAIYVRSLKYRAYYPPYTRPYVRR